MNRVDRVARLEAASGGAGGVTAIEIMFVKPTPEGPRYTGDVLVRDLVNGGERRERREDLADLPA